MQWKGGGPLALARELEVREQGMREEAHQMMLEISTEARNQQRQLIEHAETETGRRRAAAGQGVAGRIETGAMFNGIDSSANWTGADTIVGKWGWRDPERYYTYQDQGTGRIAPALSLLTSYLVARSDFVRRLRTIARKGIS